MEKNSSQTKSKRLNLLIYPTLYEELEKIAYVQHSSVNNLIGRVMQEYVAGHREDITRYDTFMADCEKSEK